MYPNRYICTVLSEMRACYETRNFANLLGLVEEAQSLANRMEAALEDQRDVRRLTEQREQLSKEVKALRKEKKELGGEEEELTMGL